MSDLEPSATGRVVFLVCPRCRKDIPDDLDLPAITRFYSGDTGWLQCDHCGQVIRWRLTITRERLLPQVRVGGYGRRPE